MSSTPSSEGPDASAGTETPVVSGPARVVAGLLLAYKRFLSPLLPPACRFSPTCSVYAREAVLIHGAGRGLLLALRRLMRCHPFHPGGEDPVPPRNGSPRKP